jgi:hypothetical protein
MLFIGNAQVNRRNKGKQRLTKIEYLSPAICPLPLTLLRKVRGEVPDDFNPERESHQIESRRGWWRSRLPFFCQKDRLNARGLEALPAVSQWSDFDDCHIEALCVLLQISLSVRMNMIQPNNGQDPVLTLAQPKPKRHNAKLCPVAIRERIINALAAGDSQRAIARSLQVSPNTVRAVAEEEWRQVDARKARIAAQAERAATKAFDLLNQKLDSDGDKITVNQLVPIAGVSVDKLLALRGDPNLRIAFDQPHQHIHAHITDMSWTDLLNRARSKSLPQQGNHAPEGKPANDSPGA